MRHPAGPTAAVGADDLCAVRSPGIDGWSEVRLELRGRCEGSADPLEPEPAAGRQDAGERCGGYTDAGR